MKVKTTGDKLPHAWVVSPNDKGRRKIYSDNKIFLNNGEEFAIELYNPTQNNVVALINLDGKPISSSGLVVRAGERFYLDCFMDDSRKFVFDTYEVENTQESNDAISKNGLLEVYFYNEKITERIDLTKIISTPQEHHHHHHYYPSRWYDPYWYNNNTIWCGTTNTNGIGTTNVFNLSTTDVTYSAINNTTLTSSVDVSLNSINIGSDSIETGQTVKGDESNQKFKEIDMTFEEEHVSNVTYFLLPESRMPKTSKDVSRASMERISDRLAEGEFIEDLFSRLYNFNELMNNKLIEKDEFELIKVKTVKSMVDLSSKIVIEFIDDLPSYISTLGDLMNTGLITEEEFKTIKSNLFNSIK